MPVFLFGADVNDVNDVNEVDVSVEIAEIKTIVTELPQKEKELAKKQYTGTIEEIMAQRVLDVNEVQIETKLLKDKTKSVAEKIKLEKRQESILNKRLSAEERELSRQKNNAEIIKISYQILNDPNLLPDPNDPNYLDEVMKNQQAMLFIMEACKPR